VEKTLSLNFNFKRFSPLKATDIQVGKPFNIRRNWVESHKFSFYNKFQKLPYSPGLSLREN
jgi:hypothetical protein